MILYSQMHSNLYKNIYAKVCEIPPGRIASYSDVAKAVGLYRGARIVGWALRKLPANTEIPWHRVINKKAELSIVNPSIPASMQGDFLRKEGLTVLRRSEVFVVENPPWFELTEKV